MGQTLFGNRFRNWAVVLDCTAEIALADPKAGEHQAVSSAFFYRKRQMI